jgi:surface polysaccharide O-acyltransferase-like enzyme
VFITGYFLVTSEFSMRKLARLILMVFFYSVLFLLVAFAAGAKIPVRTLIANLLPITTNRYPFMTTYIVLYLCSPVLNAVTSNLSRGRHLTDPDGAASMVRPPFVHYLRARVFPGALVFHAV